MQAHRQTALPGGSHRGARYLAKVCQWYHHRDGCHGQTLACVL